MTQSLMFDAPTLCGWCLTREATTTLYATPTCIACVTCSSKDRVTRWLRAVEQRKQGA